MKIEYIDHVVLTVKNIDTTIQFYTDVLGMQAITFGEGRKALKFGNQKINLHQKGHEFTPKANLPTCGSGDLCFITSTHLEEVKATLIEKQVPNDWRNCRTNGSYGKTTVYLFKRSRPKSY